MPSLNLSPRFQDPAAATEALISPSVLRSASNNRRQTMMMPPASADGRDNARPRGFSGLAEAARRSSIAVASTRPRGRSGTAASSDGVDSVVAVPVVDSEGSSSDSPSSEASAPSDKTGGDELPQNQNQKHFKKKKPLLLQRSRWQQQQQQQGRRGSESRPVPSGLASAAAAAAARTAGVGGSNRRQSMGVGAASDSGDESETAGAVAAAAVGADRAGARAMRVALEELRAERDSLANACGRLEADREAASVQLREGGEVVKKLRQAQEVLEADKGALQEKLTALEEGAEKLVEDRVGGVVQEKAEAEERAVELRNRVAELEKEREETAELVGGTQAETKSVGSGRDSVVCSSLFGFCKNGSLVMNSRQSCTLHLCIPTYNRLVGSISNINGFGIAFYEELKISYNLVALRSDSNSHKKVRI